VLDTDDRLVQTKYLRGKPMNSNVLALSVVVAGVFVSKPLLAGDAEPYEVVDGRKVDAATLGGWRTWRALACERCHGAEQEGAVGPSLVESLRRLSKEDFEKTVMNGRLEKGMPNFSASKMLNDNINGLYAYLKGRSDGAIRAGHLEPLEGKSLQASDGH
jgi:mono/diheme cytochrome c family protein